jgi:hypothetical protein
MLHFDEMMLTSSGFKVHTGIYEIIITLQRTSVTILNYNTENNKNTSNIVHTTKKTFQTITI